jgi:hypothetical protein
MKVALFGCNLIGSIQVGSLKILLVYAVDMSPPHLKIRNMAFRI